MYGEIDFKTAGFMSISDSALGNVDRDRSDAAEAMKKLYPIGAYIQIIADAALIKGREGSFGVLDSRSHRIPRICHSSYVSETYGFAEIVDASHALRIQMAEISGEVLGRGKEEAVL